MQLQQGNDDHARDCRKDIGDTFHYEVELAAIITFDRTVDRTENQVYNRHADRENKREPRARRKAGEDILSEFRRSKQERRLGDAVFQNVAVVIDIIFVIVYADLITGIGTARIIIITNLAVLNKAVFPFDANFGGIIIRCLFRCKTR